MNNARFWTYVHGWVKITLRPGQTLRWYDKRATDEGWSAEGREFEFEADHPEGSRVWERFSTDGVDCDGRLTTYAQWWFHCGAFRELTPYIPTTQELEDNKNLYPQFQALLPVWHEGDSGQRDYFAEAAGY